MKTLFSYEELCLKGNIDYNLNGKYIAESCDWINAYVIRRLLGKVLYTELSEKECDEELSACEEELMELLVWVYVYGIKSDMVYNTSFKIKDAGLIRSNDPNGTYTAATDKELALLSDRFRQKMDFYAEEIKNLINCGDCFKSYSCPCGCGDTQYEEFIGIPSENTNPRYAYYYNNFNNYWNE